MATTTTSASVSASAEEFFRKDFFFRNRSGLLDWEKICQLDLQQIVSEVDVEQLQEGGARRILEMCVIPSSHTNSGSIEILVATSNNTLLRVDKLGIMDHSLQE